MTGFVFYYLKVSTSVAFFGNYTRDNIC